MGESSFHGERIGHARRSGKLEFKQARCPPSYDKEKKGLAHLVEHLAFRLDEELIPADEAASRLAQILRDEKGDLLTTYDAAGGYGHPDHVRVHDVGARAAATAGTPVVLEATVDRRSLLRLARVLRLVPRLPDEFRPERIRSSFLS